MRTLRCLGVLSVILVGALALGCTSDVTIGAVISESGAVSYAGKRVRNGIELALEEVNAAGGFKGGSITLVYKDDATNPSHGVQVTEELIEHDGVRVIIGAVSSSVTLAIAPICEKHRVVLMSPSASATEITNAGDYIYRNYPSDIVEGTAMAKFARDLGLERVAIFAQKNPFSAGLRDIFSQQYEGRFRKVVKTVDFEEGTADQLGDAIREVAELKPDGIYLLSYLDDLASLLRQIEVAKLDSVLMGSASVTNELISMTGTAAENFVYPQPNFDVDSQDPVVASFVSAYRAKFGEDPDIYAAHGYDALKIIVEAMIEGGGAHPDDVRIGLRSIKEYLGAAGRTQFDSMGDVVRYPRIFIVRDGAAQPYETFVEEGGSLFAAS